MAYNFPIGYQPYYPQYQTGTQIPLPQNKGGIIWVQGEAGAKSYLVAPNTTVQLWDSEEQIIYLKSADASGMPSMKILDYTIRSANSPSTNISISDDNYISKDELNTVQAKIKAIQKEIEKLKSERKKKNE